MKYLGLLIAILAAIGIYLSLNILFDNLEKDIIKSCEQAYFEGQKDAINGDIRIKLDKDSIYIWTKSPWDESNRKITYYPTYLESKK